jgi:hypothetical protein
VNARLQIRRTPESARRAGTLQRELAAPVLAAAVVALCGLVARGPFLISSPPALLLGLFLAVVAGACLAAGLFAGTPAAFVRIAIALAASGTATLLLWKIATLRDVSQPAPAAALPRLLIALFALLAPFVGVVTAIAGARLRRGIASLLGG